MTLVLIFFVFSSIWSCCNGELESIEAVRSTNYQANPKPSVEITKHQFCLGCKHTVDTYAKVAALKIEEMQKNGEKNGKSIDAETLSRDICESINLSIMEEYAKFSCIKIMSEHKLEFLKAYEGSLTNYISFNKGEMFKRSKEICVNKVDACTASHFESANISKSKRSQCSACDIMVEHLEQIFDISAIAISGTQLVDNICESLGYGYHPYAWLENYCVEITDNHENDLKKLLDSKIFLEHIALKKEKKATSFSLKKEMCGRIVGCDNNKKINKEL